MTFIIAHSFIIIISFYLWDILLHKKFYHENAITLFMLDETLLNLNETLSWPRQTFSSIQNSCIEEDDYLRTQLMSLIPMVLSTRGN